MRPDTNSPAAWRSSRRCAWSAAFKSPRGAGFTVFGAAISLLAKFEGECAPGSQTYAGTGTLRYTW
jgi:hypothetical protein